METQKSCPCLWHSVLRSLHLSWPQSPFESTSLSIPCADLNSWLRGHPALAQLALLETFRYLFLLVVVVVVFSLPMWWKMVPFQPWWKGSVCDLQKGKNRIDFPRSVTTWMFFPLKAAELIDFNYIDLQLLIVVAFFQASLGANYRFP